MSHEIFWDRNRIRVRYSGDVRDLDIASAIATFQADPHFDTVSGIIHDFSDCKRLSYSASVLEEIAAKDAAAALSKRPHRVAVVGDGPDVRGLVATYLAAGFQPKEKVTVFPDVGSAEAWLER